jgi:hypothetical protein
MQRTIEDLQRAADLAGAVLLGTEQVQLRDGSWTLAGHFGFEDPWAAARLLCILAEEDASDPVVAAWAAHILEQTADENGLAPDDPELADLFAEAVHANVKRFVRFAPEEGERFQSARTTMIEGVGDCDCHARLEHALVRSQGLPSQIVFFEDDGEPVHAVDTIGTTDGMQWAETTIDADFGEHPQEAYARLGLDTRPDIGGGIGAGPTRDDVLALQTRLQDATTANALAVEACLGLPSSGQAAWSALAQRVLAWDSSDPSEADYAAGLALAQELNAFGDTLRAAGCTGPTPAPIPMPAQPPATPGNPFDAFLGALSGPLKVLAGVVVVVAGAVVAVKVADVAESRRPARA